MRWTKPFDYGACPNHISFERDRQSIRRAANPLFPRIWHHKRLD